MPEPYNPLDKLKIADNILRELLDQPIHPLPLPTQKGRFPKEDLFHGAGIYVLYYRGSFPAYDALSKDNQESYKSPIYAGKADPQGGRVGGLDLDASQGTPLFNRLREHATSIEQANNLNLEDFTCRYLVVDAVWISLGERRAIMAFAPLWNTRLDGFGNHDPGSRRATQFRSPWDTVHPGRGWAERLAPNPRSADEFLRDLVDQANG